MSALIAFLCIGCSKDLIEYEADDLKIRVEAGSEWKHPFPIFLGIKQQNSPQIAIWVEDLSGNYISTIYASHKIAQQAWMANGSNRRKESLPHWCYKRGVRYDDGLYLPTKSKPLTDGISGATPTSSFDVKLTPTSRLSQFVVKAEFNHSTDFNDFYPKHAKEGDNSYSGGKEGSGQPAVVYSVLVNRASEQKIFKAELIGHSSPDGSDGNLYTDLSTLTSAVNIVKEITISIQ